MYAVSAPLPVQGSPVPDRNNQWFRDENNTPFKFIGRYANIGEICRLEVGIPGIFVQ